MHHHSRAYSYDEQAPGYPPGHRMLPSGSNYAAPSPQAYSRGAPHDRAPTYYHAGANPHNGDYYQNVAGSASHNPQYPTPAGGAQYYPPPTIVASSSSSIPEPSYPTSPSYYTGQYASRHTGQQPSPSAQGHFIPTPSETAHPYSNYSRRTPGPQSPPISDIYAHGEYPSQSPHVVPSTHRSASQRAMQISTGRPRTAPTSNMSPTASSPPTERFPCEKCGKTFSRSHDRKRHHETQHLSTPVIHRCKFCEKEFSRADSLKRHVDNGCDEMP
ncbi:hypothetical protein BD779DRAFT_1669751 [Infundibulicybe gibba]|nr:hypothetical protein BD779DRAFT_1669751 [Infundibulicybe gibba]